MMFSLPGVTPYVPVSPNPLSARPGSSARDRPGWRRPLRQAVGGGRERSPGLPSSRRRSGGGRGEERRGGQGPQQRPECEPEPASAGCPAGDCRSREPFTPRPAVKRLRGRWLLFPCGHGKGLFYFNRCPGEGLGGFRRRILTLRPAGARLPHRPPRLPRHGRRRWLRGRRHLLGSFAWWRGQKAGLGSGGEMPLREHWGWGAKGNSEGPGGQRGPGAGGAASGWEELQELLGLSRLSRPTAAASMRRTPSLQPPRSTLRPGLGTGMKHLHQGWEGKLKVQLVVWVEPWWKMGLRSSLSNHVSSAQEPLLTASKQLLSEVGWTAKKALNMLRFGFVLPSLSSLGDTGFYPL